MKLNHTLVLMILVVSNVTGQTDIANSKDYPLLDRLPDYSISRYVEREFDAHEFYYDRKKNVHEGRKFSIEYAHHRRDDKEFQFPTRLQILRNYSNAIKKAGGRVMFERSNSDNGYYSFTSSANQQIWIQVKPAATGKSYKLVIIEESTMPQDIVINAELIKNTIELQGKIAVYGILFDTGKSIIKDESAPALEQIAAYLNTNPNVSCWVVGHTDSSGSFKTNSELSLQRAVAIKHELQTKYKIAEHRLFAEGVGPLAPIASNTTEAGKKLNRRVELVKK